MAGTGVLDSEQRAATPTLRWVYILLSLLLLILAAFSVVSSQQTARDAQLELQEFTRELQGTKQRLAVAEKERAEAQGHAEQAKKRAVELDNAKQDWLNEKHQLKGEVGLLTTRLEATNKEKEELAGMVGKAAATAAPTSKIPRILHHMYLGEDGPPQIHKVWMEGCRKFYSEQLGWSYKFWGMDDVVALIKMHRPEYLQTFKSFKKYVQRIDAGKYLILQYVGGLYLDSDVECFREGYDMLDGYDLVVQADYPQAAVNSGVIACKPNHPVWDKAFEIMHERRDHDINDTGHSTGPQIVRDMIARWHNQTLGSNGFFPDQLTGPEGDITKVYPQGQWLTPCGFASHDCMKNFMLMRATGSVNLTELVGFHRFTALWLGFKDGVQPQSEDKVLDAFCKDYQKGGR
ncbi:hypothetical protein N2152v2_000771 [Parachlorella kessleri]